MSRYPLPRKFDPRKPLEVRVAFRWAGRDYSVGDPFNWRRNGIDHRRVRQMFEAGKLKESQFDIEEIEDDTSFDFSDGLDEIYAMNDLKIIAEAEGAPIKRSIKEQRDAIREHRAGDE